MKDILLLDEPVDFTTKNLRKSRILDALSQRFEEGDDMYIDNPQAMKIGNYPFPGSVPVGKYTRSQQ